MTTEEIIESIIEGDHDLEPEEWRHDLETLVRAARVEVLRDVAKGLCTLCGYEVFPLVEHEGHLCHKLPEETKMQPQRCSASILLARAKAEEDSSDVAGSGEGVTTTW